MVGHNDAENYKNWNPVIINAVGTYEVGKINNQQSFEAKDKQVTIKSKVIKFDPPYHLKNQFAGTLASLHLTTIMNCRKWMVVSMVIFLYRRFYMNFWDATSI